MSAISERYYWIPALHMSGAEGGEIVTKRTSEIRGDLATSETEGDEQAATEMLRKERERDKMHLDETTSLVDY